MRNVLAVEWWKLRRSPVTRTVGIVLTLGLPLMALGFYSVAVSGGVGLLAAKTEAFIPEAGWPGYVSSVNQIGAVAAFLGVGIAVTWAFGREHADGTFPSLFALPVSRASIAGAKFLILGAWSVAISLLLVIVTAIIGYSIGLEPGATDTVAAGLARVFAVTLLGSLLALTIAYVASIGRGYLPGIGALLIIVTLTQVAVLFGTGEWFPYAIPGLIAVGGTEGLPKIGPVHLLVTAGLLGGGIRATIRWWRTAEAVRGS